MWYERKRGRTVTRRGEVVLHEDWAAATLDGFDPAHPNGPRVVECKDVGGYESAEAIIARYQPQVQWQMLVTGVSWCAFSVIAAGNEPVVDDIPADAAYQAELLRRGREFMESVRARTPPVELPAVPAPVDASRVYDMTGNNAWTASAVDWLANYQSAVTARAAEKALKEIVPADAKRCTGAGVRITRNRAGSLSLRAHAAQESAQ